MRFDVHRAMNRSRQRYYGVSRILLSVLGLWPYDNNRSVKTVKRLSIMVFLVATVVFQLAAYFRSPECDENPLINTTCYILIVCICAVKYCTFWVNEEGIKELVDAIGDNWLFLNNKDEQEIVAKYMKGGMLLTYIFAFAISMLCCIFVYLLLKKPSDFDFCQSTANLYLTLDYFTEDQKFVYVVTLHVTVLYAWMGIAFIGTESLIMSLFYENAGLFEVIRHRIQNAFSKETLNIPGIKKEKIVQNKLVEAVKLHQRILCHEESVVTFSYFLVLLVGVAITILNLLRLSQLKIEMSTLKILVMEIYLIFICFTYIFLINHLCQTVENNSTKLLFDIYDNLWYLAPVSSQKLLLFMMQKSKKNVLSPVGGIFLPGHEGCIKLIKMSFSYFMVIRSVQS